LQGEPLQGNKANLNELAKLRQEYFVSYLVNNNEIFIFEGTENCPIEVIEVADTDGTKGTVAQKGRAKELSNNNLNILPCLFAALRHGKSLKGASIPAALLHHRTTKILRNNCPTYCLTVPKRNDTMYNTKKLNTGS
jgi:hypothetical protein